jgi:hypothetical protein
MPAQSKIDTTTTSDVLAEPMKKKVATAKKTAIKAEEVKEKKALKPRAKKAGVDTTTVADKAKDVPEAKAKKVASKKDEKESAAPTASKKEKKAKAVPAEKKVSKKVTPVETSQEETSTDAIASSLRLNYNVDNKGYAYRTFKLISVDSVPVSKEHSATQTSRKKIVEYENKDRIILCPRNAASKIFTSWSYTNNTVDVTNISHVICIKETTRKSTHRDFYYRVVREAKLNEYCVTSPDGKKKNICSKFTNRLTALKKSDILALSSVAPATPATPVA